jgi:hypothetical protein
MEELLSAAGALVAAALADVALADVALADVALAEGVGGCGPEVLVGASQPGVRPAGETSPLAPCSALREEHARPAPPKIAAATAAQISRLAARPLPRPARQALARQALAPQALAPQALAPGDPA